jgi:hypothetical protein
MFNRITSVVQALCRALPMLTEKATVHSLHVVSNYSFHFQFFSVTSVFGLDGCGLGGDHAELAGMLPRLPFFLWYIRQFSLFDQCRSFASRSSKASGSFAVNRNANVDSTVHEKVDEVKSSALKTVAALQNTTSDPAQLAMLESLEIKIKDLRLRDEHVLLNHRELKVFQITSSPDSPEMIQVQSSILLHRVPLNYWLGF